MTQLQTSNRKLWLWLFHEGGRYTAHEVAAHMDWCSEFAVQQLFSMQRRQLIAKFPPAKGSRRKRYGVTGTCQVPTGFSVAEVQI
jgi:hypothetical protein